jgi:hypothetical protein
MVEVTWDDAIRHSGQEVTLPQARSLRPVPRHSVGWLVERGRRATIIATTVHGNDELLLQDFLTIPAGMVRRVKRLHW